MRGSWALVWGGSTYCGLLMVLLGWGFLEVRLLGRLCMVGGIWIEMGMGMGFMVAVLGISYVRVGWVGLG